MKKLLALLCVLCLLLPQSVLADYALEEDGLPWEIRNGSREDSRIAITVDDCFDMDALRGIYELCTEYGVSFTVFPLGACIKEKDADFWRELAASPYVEIGSHTMNHTSWKTMTGSGIQTHIRMMQETLDKVLGYHYEINCIRPPYGAVNSQKIGLNAVVNLVRRNGFDHVILWDVSQTHADKMVEEVQNGSILLNHARPKDLACLRVALPQLLEKGFRPVTVSQLLGFTDRAAQAAPDELLTEITE